MKNMLVVLLFFCTCLQVKAEVQNLPLPEKKLYEKDYQTSWCEKHNGKTEVRLFDKTRIDCLTDSHAVEFDFAGKWGESIGQSLYYAAVVHKKPGIVLIIENKETDDKYLQRVKTVANKYNIKVWTMSPDDLVQKDDK